MSDIYKQEMKISETFIEPASEGEMQNDDEFKLKLRLTHNKLKFKDAPQINHCAIDYCMKRFKRSVKSYHMEL